MSGMTYRRCEHLGLKAVIRVNRFDLAHDIHAKMANRIQASDKRTDVSGAAFRRQHCLQWWKGHRHIGLDAFRFIMRNRRFHKIPKVLEAPKGKDLREDVMNLETLRALVATSAR